MRRIWTNINELMGRHTKGSLNTKLLCKNKPAETVANDLANFYSGPINRHNCTESLFVSFANFYSGPINRHNCTESLFVSYMKNQGLRSEESCQQPLFMSPATEFDIDRIVQKNQGLRSEESCQQSLFMSPATEFDIDRIVQQMCENKGPSFDGVRACDIRR
ncbi:hypothetical protein QE152_g40386 [Popillia japonica]|uniref:Uncharacterized protein n=1 Tax=Popillia japonica TaxID=7064 RepID=A0AAW1HRC9_POPJA